MGDLHSAGEMQDIPLCGAEAVLFPGRGRMSSDLGVKTEHFPPKLGCPWYSTLFGPYCLSNHPHLSVVVLFFSIECIGQYFLFFSLVGKLKKMMFKKFAQGRTANDIAPLFSYVGI